MINLRNVDVSRPTLDSNHTSNHSKIINEERLPHSINSISTSQSDLEYQTPKKNINNSYSQGYSYPLRFVWFHFMNMVRKLKAIERSGRKIEVNDLPELEEYIKVENTTQTLKGKIARLDPDKVTSLQFLRMLGSSFKKSVAAILIYIFLENVTKLLVPYCMVNLIQLVKEGKTNEASFWVLMLVITNFLGTTFGQNSWTKSHRLTSQIKLGLINILYDKVSNLSAYSVKKANIGKIMNMISSDFATFEQRSVTIFITILSPLTITISGIMLCYRLGVVIGIMAIGLMFGLFPLQKKIAQRASEYTKLQSKQSDQKIKLFSEMMDGIRIIKMYGWEKAFNTIINKYRSSEVKYILINQTIMHIEHAFSLNGPLFVALVCFMFIDITDSDYLNNAIIFSTIELINLMSTTIMKNVGYGLSFIFEFKVLVQRFMSVMSIENVQMKNIDNPNLRQTPGNSPSSPQTLVQMKDFSAYWYSEDLDDKKPVLQNINFNISKGEKVSIIGQIGCGKTSLLFAIMQEIPRYRGQFYSTKNLAYVEQEPYILQGTVRDNILFGKSFNERFYLQVCKACCLFDDFKQFSRGDQTIVGERGSNLSGGQKARLCLARAVYADTDLYLLDDPLSAVDSKVAKKIFKNVINGMLKDKGVILVTHQLNYALRCNRIAVFGNGNIDIQGNPKEINFSSTTLAKYIEASHMEEFPQNESLVDIIFHEIEEQERRDLEEIDSPLKFSSKLIHSNANSTVNSSNNIESQNSILSNNGKKEDEFPVTFNTYLNYFLVNRSPWIFLLVVFTYIIQEILFTSFYKCLSLYEEQFNFQQFYAVSFGILTAFFIFKFIQNAFMSYFILDTNKSLTYQMIKSISQAKPILFDEIPSGSIINKFSNDISILDKSLPEAAYSTLEGILHFANLIVSIVFINHFFIIPGLVEVYCFYKWFMYIKPILMRAKQLDLENKTPVFQFFQSSLSGILIINVYGQKESFQKRMATLMNNNIRTSDIFWFVSRLFSVYMQYMALLTSAVGIFIILYWSKVANSSFAQSLSYLLLLTNFLHLTLRAFINMDTFMTSSERAYSIIDLPKEKIDTNDIEEQNTSYTQNVQPTKSRDKKLYRQLSSEQKSQVQIEFEDFSANQTRRFSSSNWPNKGELIFDNVVMKYKEGLDPVLKGVQFRASPLERVAIVGRTGAGKSSIIQALFRMSEIDTTSPQGASRILYDDVNTSEVSLHKLRKSISIIPQNPFVFSGSIRRNIDPLEEYSNQEINRVIIETGLNELIQQLPQGIDTDMSDSSSVFSMGQRQLVCLARVMLRKNKLMVLDEATANVDMETDQKIQSLIKDKFKDTTIITIAHRLNTIADYDKIIVLDAGKVIEVDSPFNLLALRESDDSITNTTSVFSQMVNHTGPKNAEQIFEISKQSHLDKKKYVQYI